MPFNEISIIVDSNKEFVEKFNEISKGNRCFLTTTKDSYAPFKSYIHYINIGNKSLKTIVISGMNAGRMVMETKIYWTGIELKLINEANDS